MMIFFVYLFDGVYSKKYNGSDVYADPAAFDLNRINQDIISPGGSDQSYQPAGRVIHFGRRLAGISQ